MLMCHVCLQSICWRGSPAAQRQGPGGSGHVSELPTLVPVPWLRLGGAGGSAEEERAGDGGGGECREYRLTAESREG